MKIHLVESWRYWYRKWSFWIISMIPLITAAQMFIPDIQDALPPQAFMILKSSLAVTAFVASQIKQNSIPANKAPNEDSEK